MDKLFAALRDKYDGGDVRDVKFIVNPADVADQDVETLDAELAAMVEGATPLEGPQDLM